MTEPVEKGAAKSPKASSGKARKPATKKKSGLAIGGANAADPPGLVARSEHTDDLPDIARSENVPPTGLAEEPQGRSVWTPSPPRFANKEALKAAADGLAARIGIEPGAAMEETLGKGRGLRWTRIRALMGLAEAAREEVLKAHRTGNLPLEAWWEEAGRERSKMALERWSRYDRIVLVGEGNSVAGLGLLAGESSAIRRVECPSPAALQGALHGSERALVLAAGPRWVTRFLLGVAPQVDVEFLPEDVEGHLCAFSPEALALGARSGADMDLLFAAARGALSRCRDSQADLARRLSVLWRLFEVDLDAGEARILVEGPSGAQLAAWFVGAWSAVLSKTKDHGPIRKTGGRAPRWGWLGHEGYVQELLEGPTDGFVLRLEESGEVGPDWVASRELGLAQMGLLARDGRPAIRMGLAGESPEGRLVAAVVLSEALLSLAVLRDLPPLNMPAADRLRESLSELDPLPGEPIGPQEAPFG